MEFEKEKCKVTAVITTYRREWKYIERALKSIEAQTCPPYEIMVVDDNGLDNAWSFVLSKKLKKHPAVRYMPKPRNEGVAAARNFAIRHAKGNYIAFLDDDDEWLPDKLEKQMKILERHPGVALVFGMGVKFGEGIEEGNYTWSRSIFKSHPTFEDMLANDHVGSASHPLISVYALRRMGGFRTENQPAVEDYELWIRIAKDYPIWGTRDVLYRKYMPEGDHVSGNHFRTFQGYRNIYRVNKEAYREHPKARTNILYNIVRRGVMARTPLVIPYCWMWLCSRIRYGKQTAVYKEIPGSKQAVQDAPDKQQSNAYTGEQES